MGRVEISDEQSSAVSGRVSLVAVLALGLAVFGLLLPPKRGIVAGRCSPPIVRLADWDRGAERAPWLPPPDRCVARERAWVVISIGLTLTGVGSVVWSATRGGRGLTKRAGDG